MCWCAPLDASFDKSGCWLIELGLKILLPAKMEESGVGKRILGRERGRGKREGGKKRKRRDKEEKRERKGKFRVRSGFQNLILYFSQFFRTKFYFYVFFYHIYDF